jgi:hypothetical protein
LDYWFGLLIQWTHTSCLNLKKTNDMKISRKSDSATLLLLHVISCAALRKGSTKVFLLFALTLLPFLAFCFILLTECLRSLSPGQLEIDLVPQLIGRILGEESAALVMDHLD